MKTYTAGKKEKVYRKAKKWDRKILKLLSGEEREGGWRSTKKYVRYVRRMQDTTPPFKIDHV